MNADPAGASESPLRVVVVDDHPVSRRGIISLLECEDALRVCGEARDRAGMLNILACETPDLALVDLSLGNDSGLDLIRDIRSRAPGCRILVVSMHDERLYEDCVIRAGAHGYVSKSEGPDGLIEAVRRVVTVSTS